jgi:ABC-type bacteriocin/lantibiotic exporter with double-glycine peptidase domain
MATLFRGGRWKSAGQVPSRGLQQCSYTALQCDTNAVTPVMIRVVNLNKSFEGRTVLEDINVTFEAGKTNLIIGSSGSGKTVLLKSIVGLHRIDSPGIYG